MRSRALIAGLVLLTGCGASATQSETPEPAPTATTVPTTTSTAATTTSSPAAALDGSLAEFRNLVIHAGHLSSFPLVMQQGTRRSRHPGCPAGFPLPFRLPRPLRRFRCSGANRLRSATP